MRSICIFLVTTVLLAACNDREPSPQATAAKVSGLSVETRAEVVEHKEQWNEFNGDGEAWIVIQLDDSSFRELSAEARRRGYKVISDDDPAFQDVFQRSRGVINGLYRVEAGASPFSYSLAVLDVRTRRLVIKVAES